MLKYISEDNSKFFHYKLVDGMYEILEGDRPGSLLKIPQDKEAWAIDKTNEYNEMKAREMLNTKLKALDSEYEKANLSTVTLSDGNVFNASKEVGSNPNRSLSVTRRLISDAAEFAAHFSQKEIIVSDANNNDVVYPIPTKGNKSYILPVLEIAKFEMLFFTAKREIRNQILMICNEEAMADKTTVINLDALDAIDPIAMFKEARTAFEESLIEDVSN